MRIAEKLIKIKNKFSGNLFSLVLLFTLSLIITYTYLFIEGRPFYVDSVIPLSYNDILSRYLFTWNPNLSNNNILNIMRIPLMVFFAVIFHPLTENVFIKFMFWLPVFLGMLSSYYFFKYSIYRNKIDVRRKEPKLLLILLAIFYALNPWILKHFYQYFFRLSYAILPFTFLFFLRYMENNRFRNLILTNIFFIIMATSPHFVIYILILFLSFTVFKILITPNNFILNTKKLFYLVIFLLIFNSYWILPSVSTYIGGSTGYRPEYIVSSSIVSIYSERNSIINELTLLGGFSNSLVQGMINRGEWPFIPITLFQVIFVTIPILAYSYFLKSRKKMEDSFSIYTTLLSLLIIALATGYHYPGPISWIYDNIVMKSPFYEVLRAPDRITAILPILLGYLIGKNVLLKSNRYIKHLKYFLLIILCSSLIFTGTTLYNDKLRPVSLPADFQYIENNDLKGVYVIPPRPLSGYSPSWMNSREGGIIPSFNVKFYAVPDSKSHIFNMYIIELIDQGFVNEAIKILEKVNVHKIIVRKDVTGQTGVPDHHKIIGELDKFLLRVYSGENLVIYQLNETKQKMRIVSTVKIYSDNFDDVRQFSFLDDSYPFFEKSENHLRYIQLEGDQLFHPITLYTILNELNVLLRPIGYEGIMSKDVSQFVFNCEDKSLHMDIVSLAKKGEVMLEVTGQQYNWSLDPGPNKIDVSNIDLQNHDINLTFIGYMNIRSIRIGNLTRKNNDKIANANDGHIKEFIKISPTTYKVQVDANNPFMLSFAETYDPSWVAYVEGKKVNSIPLYNVINGFWINQTGELTISIEYEPQRWLQYGSAISITTLISFIIYLVWQWKEKFFHY